MTYELAKKLKEARFPTNEKTLWKGGKNLEFGEFLPFPTLSELIEACGTPFEYLGQKFNPLNDCLFWYATGFQAEGIGHSPEEAVANLWLSLREEK